jgi:hypothetical protein
MVVVMEAVAAALVDTEPLPELAVAVALLKAY